MTWDMAKGITGGIFVDKVSIMPRGKDAFGNTIHWKPRAFIDILGCCIHQNASANQDPIKTALYHTSDKNHITHGKPLPSICYHFAIPDGDEPPWYVADIAWKTYSQGAEDTLYPGDENKHLISILVMGDFDGPSYKGSLRGPTNKQLIHLHNLISYLKLCFDFGDDGVFGHCHFGKLNCPGSVLQRQIEFYRNAVASILQTILDWQKALVRWDDTCLSKYGIDGSWGEESKKAICMFQKAHNLKITGMRDPFTELVLKKYC